MTQHDIAAILSDALKYVARGLFDYVHAPGLAEYSVDGQTVYYDEFEVQSRNGKRFRVTVKQLN